MFSRILVGYQDTEQGRDALELGRVLAQANRAELLIWTSPGEHGEDLGELARSEGADLIVLGPTHRGVVGRVVPGATAERLLGDAPCAVAVAPAGFGRPADGGLGWRPLSGDAGDAGMRVIGVGYDGSPAARKALDVAVELAIPNGAALRVYAVAAKVSRGALESQAPGVPTRAEELRGQLHDAVAELPSEVRALPEFLWGFPATELIAAAGIGVDLMVLGARGGGPVRRALNGSVASALLAEASCPVLITPLHVEAPGALVH